MMMMMMIIIIIIIIHRFNMGSYNYIPETNRVSMLYNIAAVLILRFMLHAMLFPNINVSYSCISTFRSICAVHNMAVFM